jgi:predicted nucleotidyltransferase
MYRKWVRFFEYSYPKVEQFMANAISHPSIDEITRRLPEFCRRHGIGRVEVFGSVATGEASAGSDLDLMVTFLPGIAPGLEFFAMQDELSASSAAAWIS